MRLSRPTRAAGREILATRPGLNGPGGRSRTYSVLLPVGFTMPPLLPGARCALAAPFRPCPRDKPADADRSCAGGLFSVALSLRSPPPAVSRHRFPVEPGLSSADEFFRPQRPSGCLVDAELPLDADGSSAGRGRSGRSIRPNNEIAVSAALILEHHRARVLPRMNRSTERK